MGISRLPIIIIILSYWASLVSQMVKNLPEIPETWAQSLGWEDPLEEEMATHPSILAWETPVHRVLKLDTAEQLTLSFLF